MYLLNTSEICTIILMVYTAHMLVVHVGWCAKRGKCSCGTVVWKSTSNPVILCVVQEDRASFMK